jgi:tol-pal system protein YbgF
MKRAIPVLILIVVAVGLWWPDREPVSAANREHQQLMADIRMLQEQTQLLQRMLGELTGAMQTDLETVKAKIDDQTGSNVKGFADSKLRVDTVATDVRILREKVDDTNVRISTLSQELEALRLAIPPQLPLMPPGDVTPGQLGMTPQRAYEGAWADYAAGQWSLAISGFESYIKSFPRSEQADDAQFYIGQSHYNDGRFREAVAAFDAVIANYPTGNAVPDAYYKKGLALDRLGQPDRAREAFEFVMKNFPDSAAARLAKQNMERLNRPKGQ